MGCFFVINGTKDCNVNRSRTAVKRNRNIGRESHAPVATSAAQWFKTKVSLSFVSFLLLCLQLIWILLTTIWPFNSTLKKYCRRYSAWLAFVTHILKFLKNVNTFTYWWHRVLSDKEINSTSENFFSTQLPTQKDPGFFQDVRNSSITDFLQRHL